MLITRRQNGSLTPIGTVLDAAGLSFLPDSYNLDDGVVERARQSALMTYPNLDNVSWLNLAIVDASHAYASEHPIFREQVPPSIAPLLAAGMHEELHGVAVPQYVDASDKEAADAETAAALEVKAVKEAEAAAAKLPEVKADAVPGGKIVSTGTVSGDEGDLGRGTSTVVPSAEDLDAVAEEEKLKQSTAGSDKIQ